jgi:predicted nucleotidyltransferase
MTEILAYISKLTHDHPGITELWLIGSRSNGTARPDSDWDLFAFADPKTLRALQIASDHRRLDIDLLVIIDGNEFREPWGENPKKGWLTEWEWEKHSTTEASYTSPSHEKADDEWNRPLQTFKAIRIWPTQ